MATFTPPQNATEAAGTPVGTRGPARRYCELSGGMPRGRNVYYLSDGSVTESDPDGENIQYENNGSDVYVIQMWHGSTDQPYTVTAAQASALTTAGYTVDA